MARGDVVHRQLDGGQLRLAPDQHRRDRRGDRLGGEQAVADGVGLPSRPDAELGAQRAVEPVVLAQGLVAVAGVGEPGHQGDVRLLVTRLEAQHVVPAAEQPQQLEAQRRR